MTYQERLLQRISIINGNKLTNLQYSKLGNESFKIGVNIGNKLQERSIEFKLVKQNMNSVRIATKYWDRHGTRNQLKKWYENSVIVSFEKAISEFYSMVVSKSELRQWYTIYTYSEWDGFISNYFPILLTKLAALTDISNIVIPNPIREYCELKWINYIKEEIKKIEYKLNIAQKEIEKLNHHIEVRQNKLSRGKGVYKWKWVIKKVNRKIEILQTKKSDEKKNKSTLTENLNGLNYTLNTSNEKYQWYKTHKTEYSNEIIGEPYEELVFKPIKAVLNNIDEYENKKGVYIIKNKTKNLHYVGQSKDLRKRIGQDHFDFKTGECKNQHFCDHYNHDRDEFVVAIVFCDTKDELDSLEKFYIAKFDSFYNGYNKTSGNI